MTPRIGRDHEYEPMRSSGPLRDLEDRPYRSAASVDPARGQERVRCRSVLLRDLDTLDLEPLGMIFEQPDRTARVEFFESATERDHNLSKLRREFDTFDKALAAWHRSALLCAPGEEDRLVR